MHCLKNIHIVSKNVPFIFARQCSMGQVYTLGATKK